MKWVYMVLIFFPIATFAQLPLPLTPDWLKGGDDPVGVLLSTQVALAGNNYRIVQTNIMARSRGFKLLGLITIKSASYSQAMSRLYGQAQMEEGRPQALANVIHEKGGLNVILFSLPKIRIRADLIEFTDVPVESRTNAVTAVRVRARSRDRER